MKEQIEGITCKVLGPELWEDFETLFGENGACGGCWCMHWRQQKGENWDALKGNEAKQRMKVLIAGRKATGILAYMGDMPVGWCSFGKRREYAKLDRAPSLHCEDADDVWSIPCFFVKRSFRNKGIAGIMLEAAIRAIDEYGGKVIEAYPVVTPEENTKMPDAFAWTGPMSLFAGLGFSRADGKEKGKIRMRMYL